MSAVSYSTFALYLCTLHFSFQPQDLLALPLSCWYDKLGSRELGIEGPEMRVGDSTSVNLPTRRSRPRVAKIEGEAKEKFRNHQIACRDYAYKHGIDSLDITGWRWPHQTE